MAATGTAPSQRTASSSNPPVPTTGHSPVSNNAMQVECEQTLKMLSHHPSVLGCMLILRGNHTSIIHHSGAVFEGEQGRRYAKFTAKIVERVQAGLEEIRGEDALAVPGAESDGDDVRFMRIRTKRHELLLSPVDKYLLAVLHDPAT